MAARTFDSRDITLTVQGLGDFGSNQTSVALNGITSLTGPAFSAGEHDVTDFNSDGFEREPGLPNYGEVSLTMFDNPAAVAQQILRKMANDQEVRTFNLQVAGRDLYAAASAATVRGVAIAAATNSAEAVATFSGSGFASGFDVRNFRPLAVGSTLVAGGTAFVITSHASATTATVIRLDGTRISANVSATTFKTVRPQVATSFEAYVSSISQTFGVDARNTVDVSLMVSGVPSIARTAS